MNVLISSAGRRGALIRLAKKAVAATQGGVFACDAGQWSAACRLADDWARVPRCLDPAFPESVLSLCRRWDIGLVIPTIDTELPVYARHRQQFLKSGVLVAVSGEKTIAISGDKVATHEFLSERSIPTVKQYDCLVDGIAPPLPVIIKPRFGSASLGVNRVDDEEAYHFFVKRTPDPVVQQLAQGVEYTVNFFVNSAGKCLAAVPHRRIETRGGEVSKSITHKHVGLIEMAERFATELPDAFGALCFQAFLGPDGQIRIIELNSRFGGGYPTAHAAGVNFLHWLIEEAGGKVADGCITDWQDGLAMMRWDDAIFTSEEGLAA